MIDDRYIPNEEIPYYFGAADLVVAPYRRVTGSGVVQMAIGFGVPLVTILNSLFQDWTCLGAIAWCGRGTVLR